jgi:UDP-N-acetylglucosamine acyltransferase
MSAKVHPTAIVHPSAKLADGVEIGPYVVIGEGVELGAGTFVGPHTIIEHATLGKDNRITGQAAIGTPGQDLGYKGEPTRLIMGDRNVVREGVTLNRGTAATGRTIIGSDCFFMSCSHVAHDCVVGDKAIFANGGTLGGHCTVGDRAFISAWIGVHQHVRIGTLVMLAGGAMAVQDIAPYCVAQGDRAVLRGLNLVGMRRAGFSREAITAVKRAYKTLFFSGLALDEAIKRARTETNLPEPLVLIDFAATSKRGLARPALAREGEEQEAVSA